MTDAPGTTETDTAVRTLARLATVLERADEPSAVASIWQRRR